MQEIAFSTRPQRIPRSIRALPASFAQRINKDMPNAQTSDLLALVKELLLWALIKTGYCRCIELEVKSVELASCSLHHIFQGRNETNHTE